MPSTWLALCLIGFKLTGSPIKSGQPWIDNISPYIKTILHTGDYYFDVFFRGLKGLGSVDISSYPNNCGNETQKSHIPRR